MIGMIPFLHLFRPSGELKQRRRRQRRKLLVKSEFILFQNSSLIFHVVGVEFYRNVSKFKRRIRKPLSCVTSSTKLENRQFHVVVVYRWQRNVTKKLNAECAKLLFCLSKHITIFSYVLVVFAKLPN